MCNVRELAAGTRFRYLDENSIETICEESGEPVRIITINARAIINKKALITIIKELRDLVRDILKPSGPSRIDGNRFKSIKNQELLDRVKILVEQECP